MKLHTESELPYGFRCSINLWSAVVPKILVVAQLAYCYGNFMVLDQILPIVVVNIPSLCIRWQICKRPTDEHVNCDYDCPTDLKRARRKIGKIFIVASM